MARRACHNAPPGAEPRGDGRWTRSGARSPQAATSPRPGTPNPRRSARSRWPRRREHRPG